ncbi:unnamed protein product [Phyllotreta striolata]|uniref:Mitochondrial ribonuclease P catalytic subunit n=1 Tax=Phyllotreta striolata TaxID=444603 RepID=A0A9N9TN64_PHYSR|nr:unnamed protein product [Phyllotreta striolata]
MYKRIFKLFSNNRRLIHYSSGKPPAILHKSVFGKEIFDTFEGIPQKSWSEWSQIRQELLTNKAFNEHNIDAIILGQCISKNNCSLGNSFIDYLNKEEIKFNLATTAKYFSLLYLLNRDNRFLYGKTLKTKEEELILDRYNSLRKKYEILDSITLEGSISALSLTKDWKKCITLLEDIKLTKIPSNLSYSVTASAAFLNNEIDIGWSLLQQMILDEKNIDNIVYYAYLNYLKATKNDIKIELEKLFMFLQENDIVIESDVALKISEFGNESGLTNFATAVSKRADCRNCNQKLEKFDLDNEEFAALKTAIFKNVIVGRDIFVKTNPNEVNRFNEFISAQEEFDVVLDGLNVAFSAGTRHSPQVFSSLVASVVSYFVKQGKKVLVVGRYHMKQWPRDNWSFINQNATVFLTNNISQDDPYLLYCALNSGKNTIIVTRDLMRSHKFLLKETKLRILFNRWLSQRQYQLVKVTAEGNPFFRFPPSLTFSAQKNGQYWHIPFKPCQDSNISWLCIKF